MPKLPYLSPGAVTRVTTDQFLGYHRAARIADGEMYDTRNLSTESFPMLSTRRRRGFWKSLSAPGGLIEKDALCYVEGGTLYVNDRPTPVTGLTEGDKQLVGMGAYIVIFPDKRYYNTEDETDFGALEADWSVTGTIRYAPCDVDGNV